MGTRRRVRCTPGTPDPRDVGSLAEYRSGAGYWVASVGSDGSVPVAGSGVAPSLTASLPARWVERVPLLGRGCARWPVRRPGVFWWRARWLRHGFSLRPQWTVAIASKGGHRPLWRLSAA